MATKRVLHHHHLLLQNPNPSFLLTPIRTLSLWSMSKDPSLESALSRNRRWTVNNQIKNLLLRSPDRTSTVRSLQSRFKTLGLRGSALNWLHKYPCCFQTLTNSSGNGEPLFRFSPRMEALVDEDLSAADLAEPLMAARLARLLMMSRGHRLNVVKFNALRKSFGLPDDYILRLVPKHPDTFRVLSGTGRRSSMEIELVKWDPDLAVSAVESAASGSPPRFSCSLPETWIKSREKFDEFNDKTPYISPYSKNLVDLDSDPEKRAVGVVHELLSLTLWKKASILKLEHFRKEFGLPEKLNRLLMRHPCIFYVSNKYKIYTVVLREGYKGSELVERDPMVVVKDKFGELMQEGLHEYNRRRCAANLEKKRKRGEIGARVKKEEEEDEGEKVEKREERRRFYKVLFDEDQ
ncbi:protein ROOT PRIMORDIUM DEFECTIVE 1 [Iris pallida]|uniref:Protein ROOT PRIMORDIUM DEFECTIVE 1 n=1 Tax=Iris pallida TaxID=29817 RepID=A0AAX6E1Y8_IRIPA|nr:protein ROOT PRIMORDIUM DEFECTIVE 1 [Iris pallida]